MWRLTLLGLAFWDVVHPVAHTSLPVVGEAGATLVAGGLTVPARPEHGAVLLVGEDAVQVGAVGGGNRGFCEGKESYSERIWREGMWSLYSRVSQ